MIEEFVTDFSQICSIVADLNTLSKQQRKRDLPTDVLVMLFLQDCRCSCLRFYLVCAYW